MKKGYRVNGKIKALIVDDDGYIRSYIHQLLEMIGFKHILEATDGASALAVTKREGANLVFLDVNMAPMNGLEFLKAVRTGEIAGVPRDLPVVVLTGSDDDMVLGAALALDCDAFLKKPSSQTEIAKKIWRIFEAGAAIKPPVAYKVIPTEVVNTPAETAHEDEPLPDDAIVVTLDDLEPGQVLSTDIRTQSGNTLLTAGTKLTGRLINRLRDIGAFSELMRIAIGGTAMEKEGELFAIETGSSALDDGDGDVFKDDSLFAMKEKKSAIYRGNDPDDDSDWEYWDDY